MGTIHEALEAARRGEPVDFDELRTDVMVVVTETLMRAGIDQETAMDLAIEAGAGELKITLNEHGDLCIEMRARGEDGPGVEP